MRDGTPPPSDPTPDPTGDTSPGESEAVIDLPPPETLRWVARRKAQVLLAIDSGQIALEEACVRYNLSEEEINAWRQLASDHGPGALRATRLKDYRLATVTTRIERRGRKPRAQSQHS